MRNRWRWKHGVAAVVLAASLGGAATARAQQPLTIPMAVTENRAPGAAGQSTITPLGNNQIRVDIRLTGLQANAEHAAHIHIAQGAVCDNGAPIVYPLTNVRADASGVGTSTSTITVTADKPIPANNAYVNVHQAANPPGPGAICGNITASFAAQAGATAGAAAGAGATGQAQPTPPRTGAGIPGGADTSGWGLAGLAALVLALGGAGIRMVTRRR